MTSGEALAAVVADLCCPVCAADLALAAGSLRCAAGHGYDVARQGYVNLLPGGARPGTADTPAMVRARAEFLAAGHYAPIAAQIAAVVGDAGLVVDVGAGTGWYLARTLGAGRGIALDVSKHAARVAARAHPRVAAVVADAWAGLPVRTGAADVLLDVFAPRNPAEFARVLRPGGTLVVITPAAGHLAELRAAYGLLSVEEAKTDRLDAALAPYLRRADRAEVAASMSLSAADARRAAAMGPSAFHLDLDALPDWSGAVTLAVTVSTYRLAGRGGAG